MTKNQYLFFFSKNDILICKPLRIQFSAKKIIHSVALGSRQLDIAGALFEEHLKAYASGKEYKQNKTVKFYTFGHPFWIFVGKKKGVTL